MKLTTIITLLALSPTASLPAIAADGPECATDQLAALASTLKLPASGLDTINASHNGRPLSIGLDSQGRVDHIGYTIFSQRQREILDPHIVNFIERYALLADVGPQRSTAEKQMLEDGVSLKGCRLNNLAATVGGNDIALSVQNLYGRTFKVMWHNGDNRDVTMEFPLSYDLLSGCDIDESERRLPDEISRFKPDTTAVTIIPAELRLDSLTNVLATPPETYFAPGLTSSRYYDEFEGEIDPLYDLDFPALTMANLLTGTDIPNDFTITARLRCYNYREELIRQPLSRFVGYFIAQGCKPYFGVISAADGKITGEVLYVNHDLGYCHAIKATLDEKGLINRDGTITARMVSYIPVSRISNIFDEFK